MGALGLLSKPIPEIIVDSPLYIVLSLSSNLPSPLTSKKIRSKRPPVNGLKAIIKPRPVGLQISEASGIRTVPINTLPWNILGITIRSPLAGKSKYQPDLSTNSSAVPKLLTRTE